MDLDDQIPIRIRHVLEADIPQNTRIIDEHIYSSKVLDCRLDDLVSIFDAVVVGNRFASSGADFVNDQVGSLNMPPLAHGQSSNMGSFALS